MATKKKPVVKSIRPAAAPKSGPARVKAVVPAAPKATVAAPATATEPVKAAMPVKLPKPESGKTNDGKDKKGKKKDKKVNEGDNAAGSKQKMVRDSFTMPAPDYALIGVLKARTLASGTSVKKSELLRAGLVALAALSAAQLIDLIAGMPQVKTGRPGKKKK